ncbi:hypothetical protein IKP85_05675 [bacterium]|nr:hypothetical protein [bacterium]
MTTETNAAHAASFSVAKTAFESTNVITEESEDKIKELKESMNQSELKVSNDIKSLAEDVGLSCEATDTPDEIIAAIADELEAQIDDAENNPQALSTLMGYYSRLNSLDQQLDEIYCRADEMFSARDMYTVKNREEFGF